MALEKASLELTEERLQRDGLAALEKDSDERRKAIDKDRRDRNELLGKRNEARARRLETVSNAVDAKQQEVDSAKLKVRSLQLLQTDVSAVFAKRRGFLKTCSSTGRKAVALPKSGDNSRSISSATSMFYSRPGLSKPKRASPDWRASSLRSTLAPIKTFR